MKKIRYVGPDGIVIYIEVPWEDHSGMIPPPIITFYNQSRGQIDYFYNPE